MTELFLIIISIYVGVSALTYFKMDRCNGQFNTGLALKSMCWPFVAFSLYFKHISSNEGNDA